MGHILVLGMWLIPLGALVSVMVIYCLMLILPDMIYRTKKWYYDFKHRSKNKWKS